MEDEVNAVDWTEVATAWVEDTEEELEREVLLPSAGELEK